MILPKFDYLAPDSISAGCSLLAQVSGRPAIMAGGTDLIVRMKQRTLIPELIISLKRIPELRGLTYSETEGLEIGAMVSLQELTGSTVVKDHFPILAEAASLVGSIQHQFMGTVGGNLCLDTRCFYYNQPVDWRRSIDPCHKLGGGACHSIKGARKCSAIYAADVGSVLYALDATVVLANCQGEKVIPLEAFFSDDPVKPFHLQKDEVITKINIQAQTPRIAQYYKLRQRRALDFPQVGVAFVAFPEKREYRVVINALAGKPLRFRDLEEMLSHDRLSESLLTEFIANVVSRVKPVDHVSTPSTYRRKMVGILLSKAFEETGIVS